MSHRLYPLFHLIAYRGLRRGEAVGIRWPDVDAAGRQLRITQQVVQTRLGDRDRQAQDRQRRTYHLLWTRNRPGAAPVARAAGRRARRHARRLAGHRPGVHPRGRQSAPPRTTSPTPSSAIAKEAGLPPIRLHDLRHTAASLALQAGVPMKVVSEQLGHSSLGITADTYTSVLPAVAQAAAEAVAGIVPRRAADRPLSGGNGTSPDGHVAAAFTVRSLSGRKEGRGMIDDAR